MRTLNLKPYELEYIKKRILITLGQYCESGDGVVYSGSRKAELERGMASAVYSSLVEIYRNFYSKRGIKAPFIDENTQGDFEIQLEELSLEALICLAASKLCSENESSTYTRLLYKYKDLCEGAFEIDADRNTRNSFYVAKDRGRIV